MWLLKILEKHSQNQKVHGLAIRLSINNTAKGLGEKDAYEITIIMCVHAHACMYVCVCVCGGGGCAYASARVSNRKYMQAQSGTNMS